MDGRAICGRGRLNLRVSILQSLKPMVAAVSARGGLKYFHLPGKFNKGRSQEKTHLLGLEFFLLRSPFERGRFVLTYRAM